MQILTEIVGGTVILIVFAYGLREVFRFIKTMGVKNVDVQPTDADAAKTDPGAGDGHAD